MAISFAREKPVRRSVAIRHIASPRMRESRNRRNNRAGIRKEHSNVRSHGGAGRIPHACGTAGTGAAEAPRRGGRGGKQATAAGRGHAISPRGRAAAHRAGGAHHPGGTGHAIGGRVNPRYGEPGPMHGKAATRRQRVRRTLARVFAVWRTGLPRPVLVLQGGNALNYFGTGLILPFEIIYLHAVRGFSTAT